MDKAVDSVHVSIAMVLNWHKIFRDGRESIDDDKRPGRPTEFGDAMIDDIRHAVQEGSASVLYSAVSVPIVH